MRFGNNYYYTPYAHGRYPNLTTYTIGNIELCVNGSYYDLCADQLTPEQALFLCCSTGETYDRAYLSPVIGPINETFSYDPSSDSVANSSCPYSYFSSSCSFDLVYGNGCANNGGVAVISCIRGKEHYQYCSNCHLIVPCILAKLIWASMCKKSMHMLLLLVVNHSQSTGFTVYNNYLQW